MAFATVSSLYKLIISQFFWVFFVSTDVDLAASLLLRLQFRPESDLIIFYYRKVENVFYWMHGFANACFGACLFGRFDPQKIIVFASFFFLHSLQELNVPHLVEPLPEVEQLLLNHVLSVLVLLCILAVQALEVDAWPCASGGLILCAAFILILILLACPHLFAFSRKAQIASIAN